MPSFSTRRFLRVVWFSALYDLIVTAPFATPWTFELSRTQFSAINVALGGQPLPAFDAFHTLFALLMGSVALVWAVLRLRGPTVQFGRYDAAARMLFGLWMGWALWQTGAPVMLLFIVPEVSWAAAQSWWVKRAPST
ncbi:MAG: hypothetical protein JF607_01425 [Burkholderiales bacterium]|jgi:hypothetical protein|nr:hypothetical protein [Burkholderiales bacterium]MBW8893546.1 hypothetical protein [Burkholderiales bacterium]